MHHVQTLHGLPARFRDHVTVEPGDAASLRIRVWTPDDHGAFTGGFTIGGGLAVAIVSALLARSSEMRKVKVEDSRRWLLDRRAVYAKYLALAEVMLREIDGVAAFLSYDGESEISDKDDDII